MVLAIANRELAAQGFPEAFAPDEEKADEPLEVQPCGAVNAANESEVCVGNGGHRGRHRFRKLAVETTNGLVN